MVERTPIKPKFGFKQVIHKNEQTNTMNSMELKNNKAMNYMNTSESESLQE